MLGELASVFAQWITLCIKRNDFVNLLCSTTYMNIKKHKTQNKSVKHLLHIFYGTPPHRWGGWWHSNWFSVTQAENKINTDFSLLETLFQLFVSCNCVSSSALFLSKANGHKKTPNTKQCLFLVAFSLMSKYISCNNRLFLVAPYIFATTTQTNFHLWDKTWWIFSWRTICITNWNWKCYL